MTPEEDLQILAEEAKKIEDGVILETGTCNGESARVLEKNSWNTIVYTIDIRNVNKDLPLKIIFLEGDSKDKVKKWFRPIDLLFIDGGHDMETIRSDFFGFGEWVKKGGSILLHDYNNGRNAHVNTFVNSHLNHPEYKAIGKRGKMIYKYIKI